MFRMLARDNIRGNLRSGRFWGSLAIAFVLACIAGTVTAIAQAFVIERLDTGDHERVLLLYISIVYSLPIMFAFLLVTLPLTILWGAGARTSWLIAMLAYGACGWAIWAGYAWILSVEGSPAAMGTLAILPAAACGLIIWWRLLREGRP